MEVLLLINGANDIAQFLGDAFDSRCLILSDVYVADESVQNLVQKNGPRSLPDAMEVDSIPPEIPVDADDHLGDKDDGSEHVPD